MAILKSEYGMVKVERVIPFSRSGHAHETVRIEIMCEGKTTPGEIQKIAEIADETKEKMKKIVEEW